MTLIKVSASYTVAISRFIAKKGKEIITINQCFIGHNDDTVTKYKRANLANEHSSVDKYYQTKFRDSKLNRIQKRTFLYFWKYQIIEGIGNRTSDLTIRKLACILFGQPALFLINFISILFLNA